MLIRVVANLNLLATTVVRDRVAFRRAFAERTTAVEYGVDRKAAAEMRDLHDEVSEVPNGPAISNGHERNIPPSSRPNSTRKLVSRSF
jgi:hypothetical protein